MGGATAVLAVFLLAGCTQPLGQEPPPAPAAPGLIAEEVPFVGETFAGKETCAADRCLFHPANPPVFRPILANQTVTGIHLVVTGDMEASVRLTIQCDARECPGLPLVAAGPLPLAFDADGLALQGPMTLRAEFERTDGVVLLVEQFVALTLNGTLATLRDPTPALKFEVHQVGGTIDHVTGFCVFVVDPNCASTSNTLHLPIPGPVVRFRVNLTWDALSPTAESLGLQVRCLRDFVASCADGVDLARVDGASPLMLDIEAGWVPVGGLDHEVMIEIFEGDLPAGGTRQPFRLEWTMDILHAIA